MDPAGTPPRVSDQLELELAGPGRAWYEPWAGRNPRLLTKASIASRLRPRTPGGSASRRGHSGVNLLRDMAAAEQLSFVFMGVSHG